jgi:uncharacterized membrane protein
MSHHLKKNHVWMTTKRIETLVDGIFAIAMTLLVLNIDVPQITGIVTDPILWQYLVNLSHQLYIYAFSFALLASFWKGNHHQFFYIKESDSALIWINIIWLMFVALVPFSTNFVSDYGSHQIPMLFFNFNMLIIGIFFSLNWTYVTRKDYFIEGMTQKNIDRVKRINYELPFVALIAIGVTFISPQWSPFSYILLFFLRNIIN